MEDQISNLTSELDYEYVPISKTLAEVCAALESPESEQLVILYGGLGEGKTSLAKHVFTTYKYALSNSIGIQDRSLVKFGDGVFFFSSGHMADARSLLEELWQNFLFENWPPGISWPSTQLFMEQLRWKLREKNILVVIDDVWEDDLIDEVVIRAPGIKYLITSGTIENIWRDGCVVVPMESPTLVEARQIFANRVQAFGKRIPTHLEAEVDDIIEKSFFNPLTIANVAISINNDVILSAGKRKIEKKDLKDLIESKFCTSPVVFSRVYWKETMANATAAAIKGFRKDTKIILSAAALSISEKIPESFLRLFFKTVHSVLSFHDCRKDLESCGLIQREGEEDIWILHKIWQAVGLDVLKDEIESLISKAFDSPSIGTSREDEAELLQALLFLYGQPNLQERAKLKLDVPGEYSIYRMRTCLEPFVCMLNADPIEEWEKLSHESAKQVIIQYIRLGKLHDRGMSNLLLTPVFCSRACKALNKIARISNRNFLTPQHTFTVRALLEVQTLLCESDSITAVSAASALLNLIYLQSTPVETIVMVVKELRALPSFFKLLYTVDMQKLIVLTISHMLSFGHNISGKIGTLPGVVEALAKLLTQNDAPQVQREAAGALANLCSYVAENRIRVGSCPGAIEGLVGLLSKDMDPDMDPSIQEAAATALANLCLFVKEITTKVGSCPGAVEAIVSLLAKDMKPQVQARACTALANLCIDVTENKIKVASCPGAVERLVELLGSTDNPYAQYQAVATLANLCNSVTDNSIMLGSFPGTLEGLLKILSDHADQDLRRNAANVLANLCAEVADNRIKLGSCPGAVEVLVSLLAHTNILGLRGFSALIIQLICDDVEENQIRVGLCKDAVKMLKELLAKDIPIQIRLFAAQALVNIFKSQLVVTHLQTENPGMVEQLFQFLNDERDSGYQDLTHKFLTLNAKLQQE